MPIDKHITLEVRCKICSAPHIITVPLKAYAQWANKEKGIQHALHMLSAEEREMLLSKMCPKCWNKAFRED